MKDLEYTVESLRAQYKAEPDPERRADIEALGRKAAAELQLAQASLVPTVAEIDAAYGPGMSADLIAAMILKLRDYLNIGKNITGEQVNQTAEVLAAEYRQYTIEHFATVFQRVKLGKMGKVYDRLDGVVIAGWLDDYIEELRREVQLREENHHLATKTSRLESSGTYRISDIMREMTRENLSKQ